MAATSFLEILDALAIRSLDFPPCHSASRNRLPQDSRPQEVMAPKMANSLLIQLAPQLDPSMHDLGLGHSPLHAPFARPTLLTCRSRRRPVIVLEYVVQSSTTSVPELDGRMRANREDGGEEAQGLVPL